MLCKFVAFPLDPQAAGGLAPDLLIWLFALLAILVGAAIGFFNGVLVAVIGIPSIIATLCYAVHLSRALSLIVGNGLQFSIRGIDSYSLLPRALQRRAGAACPAQAVWGLVARGGALVRPQPAPLRRAPAVHRRQPGRGARGRHRREAREDQAVHADGRAGRRWPRSWSRSRTRTSTPPRARATC